MFCFDGLIKLIYIHATNVAGESVHLRTPDFASEAKDHHYFYFVIPLQSSVLGNSIRHTINIIGCKRYSAGLLSDSTRPE